MVSNSRAVMIILFMMVCFFVYFSLLYKGPKRGWFVTRGVIFFYVFNLEVFCCCFVEGLVKFFTFFGIVCFLLVMYLLVAKMAKK